MGSDMNINAKQLPAYISSLLRADVYDHAVENIQLIETHISWVILTGPFAYKIKKPVNLGFLDFSTLEKRHFYCNEELRLNSRLAAAIYLKVIPITGSEDHAAFAGSGKIIEYAIKMVQFPQQMQLDRMLAASLLQTEHIDALAAMVAEFHQHTGVANKDINYGSPEQIYHPIKENFILLQQLLNDDTAIAQLTALESWSQTTFKRLKPILVQRKRDGFIRECHGDLHLRNLVFINEKPVAFDCIEFDPELRWIDSISDLAFLIMDLQDRQQANFAQRLLNAYLEKTGDYAAVQILPFYLVYRAMVRAKVEAIRASQMASNSKPQDEAKQACYGYLKLAQSYLHASTPMLIITCGMSASGKSTLTQPLVEKLAAIRVRSDVERKRLFKSAHKSDSPETFNAGIYTPEATQKTYQHLAELAEQLLNADYPVIIDATCLKYEQRNLFRQVAARNTVPFVIVEFTAQPNTLRQRINSRKKEASDADQSILEQQLLNWQALHKNELPDVISINTESSTEIDSLVNKITMLTSLQSQ
ncbi:MAG: AAA family ATPase [Methylomarinum sp.]|nr:AAA family ATPase [Methylomarinum sp.]